MKAILFGFVLICGLPTLSQAGDSTRHRNPKVRAAVKSIAPPIALIGLGFYTKDERAALNRFDVKNWRDDNFPNFSNRSDDILQYVPIVIVYGLDLLKVKAKNDLLNRTLLLVKSEILVNGIAQLLKATTHIKRPDSNNDESFPSGHTAQAFAAATFMHKELGDKSVWYSIGAYTMASTVGAFRVFNNRHWVSDVLVGAGLGILSTDLVYRTHRYKWGKRPSLTVLPTYTNGPGVYVSLRLE
jgi:membrane-associated phospholipid phosphatase